MKSLHRRVLLKISGEALRGPDATTTTLYDKPFTEAICDQIIALQQSGIELAIVIGGGNVFRGSQHGVGNDPTTDHFIGMTATLINGMLLQELLRHKGCDAVCLTAIDCPKLCTSYTPALGRKALNQGKVLILAGGSGNPFCSTDFAGVLRAVELDADIMWKATKVDGIYTADPVKDPSATKLSTISYTEAIAQELKIIDQTAFVLGKEHNMPIQIFSVFTPDNLVKAATSTEVGSLVSS